jgi:hypothetical protein
MNDGEIEINDSGMIGTGSPFRHKRTHDSDTIHSHKRYSDTNMTTNSDDSNSSDNGNGNGKAVVRMARFYEKGFWVAITVIIMLVGSFFMNGASKKDIDDKITAHSEKTTEQLASIRMQIEMVIRRQDRMIENVESTNVAVGKLQTQVDKMNKR